MDLATIAGGFAAFCTTVSYFPQIKKCWDTGEAEDLSAGMLSILALGLSSWVVYGVLRSDAVVIVANTVSVCLVLGLLGFKVRQVLKARRRS